MDAEFAKWLVSLGVGGALAWGMFLVYRKDAKQYADLSRTQAELWKAQAEILVTVVRDNSVAITRNTAVIEHFISRQFGKQGGI